MKVYYVNDTKKPKAIFNGDLTNKPIVLEPAQGGMFEVEVLEGQGVFIKEWSNGTVLLSSFDLKEVK